MINAETYGLIGVILSSVAIVFLVILYLRKPTSEKLGPHFIELQSSLSKEVAEIKTAMTNSLFDAMLKFNQ
jgi:hypothetical protein